MAAKIESGPHLGAVRKFLQREAYRGEHLTWGSQEAVQMAGVTVNDMEMLAQDIRNAVLRDIARYVDVCASFKSEFIKGGKMDRCEACGYHRRLHEVFGELS